jgi:hypothetical protein
MLDVGRILFRCFSNGFPRFLEELKPLYLIVFVLADKPFPQIPRGRTSFPACVDFKHLFMHLTCLTASQAGSMNLLLGKLLKTASLSTLFVRRSCVGVECQ